MQKKIVFTILKLKKVQLKKKCSVNAIHTKTNWAWHMYTLTADDLTSLCSKGSKTVVLVFFYLIILIIGQRITVLLPKEPY